MVKVTNEYGCNEWRGLRLESDERGRLYAIANDGRWIELGTPPERIADDSHSSMIRQKAGEWWHSFFAAKLGSCMIVNRGHAVLLTFVRPPEERSAWIAMAKQNDFWHAFQMLDTSFEERHYLRVPLSWLGDAKEPVRSLQLAQDDLRGSKNLRTSLSTYPEEEPARLREIVIRHATGAEKIVPFHGGNAGSHFVVPILERSRGFEDFDRAMDPAKALPMQKAEFAWQGRFDAVGRRVYEEQREGSRRIAQLEKQLAEAKEDLRLSKLAPSAPKPKPDPCGHHNELTSAEWSAQVRMKIEQRAKATEPVVRCAIDDVDDL